MNKNKALEYFNSYQISEKILGYYGVSYKKEDEDLFEILYPYDNGVMKICTPNFLDKKYRTDSSNLNGSPKVFGLRKISNKNGKVCFITGGEKDVLSFAAYGYPAICFNSETTSFDSSIINDLKSRFEKVIICFDNDATGIEQSSKKSSQFGLPVLTLPEREGLKDISDFRKAGFGKEELDELIPNAIIHESMVDDEFNSFAADRSRFTAGEIIDGKTSLDSNDLIPGILPAADVSGLVGGSQSGKSLLSLQFLLCLSTGKPFLGFHHGNKVRSVYLSLEDNIIAVRSRLIKQISDFTEEERNLVKKGIIFEFSPFDIEAKLHEILKSDNSIKAIIIDPMSEIMVEGDLNNTSYVRKTIQMLREISRTYGTSIIYIHHINKTAEINGHVSKLSVSGSHAFEASVRSLFFMQKEKDGSSTIGIVKGNHIKDEWKYPKKKLTLNLDEGTMTYHKTVRIDLKKKENNNPADSIDWLLVFGDDEELATKEIKKRIKDLNGMAERSIERIISEVLTPYRISTGVYRSPGFELFQL